MPQLDPSIDDLSVEEILAKYNIEKEWEETKQSMERTKDALKRTSEVISRILADNHETETFIPELALTH